MNTTPEPLGLHSPDGRRAQLLSVQLEAEVLGLMLRLRVRQIWRNTTGAPMAARLDLNLSHGQCLLELQLQRGDGPATPVHTLPTPHQRCPVALGVLQTGEQWTVQWRVAELLDLQGGSLRLQWPARLLPPAVRPGRLTLALRDPVARGTLGSASHVLQKVRHASGLTLGLLAPRGLEQDFGLSVHGLRETGLALASADPSQAGHGMLLASHAWRRPNGLPEPPLRLKLVVDPTGGIPPEWQSALHSTLDTLLARLQPHDQLSLSRLDPGLQHELPRLQPCTEAYVRRARALLRHMPGEPGTPDWAAVLQAVIDIVDEEENPVQDASVLLITAHPLDANASLLGRLREHGHRLHVLTVGEAAGCSDWAPLARLSDGQGLRLGSGPQGLQALQRLFERMGRLHPVQAQLSVQGQALTDVHSPHRWLADGETLHAWAPLPIAPPLPQAPADAKGVLPWPIALQWQTESHTHSAPETVHAPTVHAPHVQQTGPWPVLWDAQGDLVRLCAHLMAPLPPAAAAAAPAVLSASPAAPSRPAPDSAIASVHPLPASKAPAHPMAAFVQQFNQQAGAYRHFRAALSATLQRCSTRPFDGLVMPLARQAGNPGRVWALLLHQWHAEQTMVLQPPAVALVEQELAPWPIGARSAVHAQLKAALGALNTQTSRQAA